MVNIGIALFKADRVITEHPLGLNPVLLFASIPECVML